MKAQRLTYGYRYQCIQLCLLFGLTFSRSASSFTMACLRFSLQIHSLYWSSLTWFWENKFISKLQNRRKKDTPDWLSSRPHLSLTNLWPPGQTYSRETSGSSLAVVGIFQWCSLPVVPREGTFVYLVKKTRSDGRHLFGVGEVLAACVFEAVGHWWFLLRMTFK